MREVIDDLGRALQVEAPARRIVSLVPSLTETIALLCTDSALVGVTRYCTEPPDRVAGVARVGGTKTPDIARIIALRPDAVVMNREENREDDFAALEAAGVPIFVSYPRRVADVPDLLRRLGGLAGAAHEAATCAAALERAIDSVRSAAPLRGARVFCPIWKKPWMAFNADTYPHDVIATLGGVNVCADMGGRFPIVDLEEIARRRPDVVLLPDEPYRFGRRDLESLDVLRETPAGRNGRVHLIDGKAVAWYGARTAHRLGALAAVLRG